MKRSPHARAAGFTLIELLVTISIVALLIGLLVPNLGRIRDKADSVKCAANLRSIVAAAQLFAQDNDGRYPQIESMPSQPVYPAGAEAGTLLAVLGPYGITEASLRCPGDLRLRNPYFKKEGSSYMWRPMVDDELVNAPKIYHPRRGEITPSASRLALISDFVPLHGGRLNVGFADGRVRMF